METNILEQMQPMLRAMCYIAAKEAGDIDLSEANLWRADLRGANLSEANLWRADLREANLRGANLRGANLSEANLRGADLWEADLWEADLRGADLRGADLSEANLRGANLWGANLWGANLRGANLWFSAGIKVALNIGSENRGVIIYQYEDVIMASSGNGCFKGTAEQYKDALRLKYSGKALTAYLAIIDALVLQLEVDLER